MGKLWVGRVELLFSCCFAWDQDFHCDLALVSFLYPFKVPTAIKGSLQKAGCNMYYDPAPRLWIRVVPVRHTIGRSCLISLLLWRPWGYCSDCKPLNPLACPYCTDALCQSHWSTYHDVCLTGLLSWNAIWTARIQVQFPSRCSILYVLFISLFSVLFSIV